MKFLSTNEENNLPSFFLGANSINGCMKSRFAKGNSSTQLYIKKRVKKKNNIWKHQITKLCGFKQHAFTIGVLAGDTQADTWNKHLTAMKYKQPETDFSLCTCSMTDGTRVVFVSNQIKSVLETEFHWWTDCTICF